MRKKSFIPELTLVVRFANLIVQIFLPLSNTFDYKASFGKTPMLNLFPAFAFNVDFKEGEYKKKVNFGFSVFDLTLEESVAYDNTIEFTFKSLTKETEDV